MDVRCLAGACVSVGPLRDGDGDGRAPPPCGDDCDDASPDTYTGARERCDGRDNDCDGEIDDGAPRLDATFPLSVGDPTSLVLPWGGGFLVTELSSSVLWGLPVGLDGTVGAPVEVARLTMGTRFAAVAGAAQPDGRVLVVTLTDLGVARWVELERDETTGDARRLAGPGTMPTPEDVSVVEAIAFDGGWAIGFDATTPFGAERLVTLDPSSDPVIRVPLAAHPADSFGLATDGTHVVVSDDGGNVVFFDGDGAEVGRHAVAATLPGRPLASWDGSVVVALPDDFDFVLAHLDLAGGLGSAHPAPFGDASDVVRIASAAGLVLMARTDVLRTNVQALRGDLATYEGGGVDLGRSGIDVTRVSVADSEGAVGVLGTLSAMTGSDLGVLLGCAGGG